MNKTSKGMMIAASVATLLASGTLLAGGGSAPKAEAKVHCTGINACKGHGECAGDGHGCAGGNSCKGKGWVDVSAKECADKKGTVMGQEKKSAPASSAAASAPMAH
jgi:hypothetical protein